VEMPEILESMLLQHWQMRGVRLEALSSGHTNKTYRVHDVARAAILRVSWPGKSLAQVEREAGMLQHLSDCAQMPALPRLIPTLTGQACAQTADGIWLHLFEAIEGAPGMPRDAHHGTVDAMRTLAGLHAKMATLATDETRPLAWLQDRYARVIAREAPRLSEDLTPQFAPLMGYVEASLAHAAAWIDGPARWLHGDYHAGNLLFDGPTLKGVIDFDDVGQGAQWLEAAFALFAMSRDASVEARFTFDARLWNMGLAAYAETRAEITPVWMHAESAALMRLFCIDQVLIHLEAAQRGLWIPGAGMGFLACWRELVCASGCIETPVGIAQE
jgi:Ser/Thr protein kinase RdoA (MazF antagonist)